MRTLDIDLVESSFAAVYARKAELAERFYVHLFSLMPEAEALFGDDFSKQKEMFATMLTYCIKGLVARSSLGHAGTSLAKTHARLNLGPRETDIAGRAVMAALEDVMAENLTDEQRAAWQRAISRVLRMMVPEPSATDAPATEASA